MAEMNQPGLLLIRGLGHSGSTILDLALGAHPQVIGLGEAVRVLDRPRPGEERKGPQQLRGALRFERRAVVLWRGLPGLGAGAGLAAGA